ncbi:MAG: ADP-glyceromanno-heptose 6-epimerase [Candidatus Binataceae bacterium]
MFIVTGGAGFIGSNLLAVLEARGREGLVVVDRTDEPQKAPNIAKRRLAARVAPEDLDRFLADNAKAVRGIFHLGALTSTTERDRDALQAVNVVLSQTLWRWCAARGVPFIYASSAATYGDGSMGFDDNGSVQALAHLKPLNPYGESKQAFDLWVARTVEAGGASPPRWAGLKFFNVYGPNELHKGSQASLVPQIYARARNGESYALFRSHNPDYADGAQARDFIFVDDCCEAMIWLMVEARTSGIFNLGTGKARTFQDMAAAVYASARRPLAITFRDTPQDIRAQYQYFTQARMERLRAAGYAKPFTSLEDGVAQTIERYLSQPDPYR